MKLEAEKAGLCLHNSCLFALIIVLCEADTLIPFFKRTWNIFRVHISLTILHCSLVQKSLKVKKWINKGKQSVQHRDLCWSLPTVKMLLSVNGRVIFVWVYLMSISELITLHSDVVERNVPLLGRNACYPHVDVEVRSYTLEQTIFSYWLSNNCLSGGIFNRDI